MTEFLVRHFVKDYEAVEKSAVRTAYGVLASMVGIVCNVFLFLVKFIVGLLLHHQFYRGEDGGQAGGQGASVRTRKD